MVREVCSKDYKWHLPYFGKTEDVLYSLAALSLQKFSYLSFQHSKIRLSPPHSAVADIMTKPWARHTI